MDLSNLRPDFEIISDLRKVSLASLLMTHPGPPSPSFLPTSRALLYTLLLLTGRAALDSRNDRGKVIQIQDVLFLILAFIGAMPALGSWGISLCSPIPPPRFAPRRSRERCVDVDYRLFLLDALTHYFPSKQK